MPVAATASPSTSPSPGAVDSPLWEFPPGRDDVVLPAHFLPNGAIIIRMTANGRGLDLLLDTGAPDIIDASVASSLQDGSSPASPLVLSSVRFGDATLHDARFRVGSFYRREATDTRIVGVLGYEFLQRAVVKIDYEHESIHLLNPSSFVVPAGAAALALSPLNRVPVVAATVGTAKGAAFIIDTGATTVVVFPELARANPAEFTAQTLLKDDASSTYFRFFWPVCGEIQQDPYAVSQVVVGSVGLRDWVVWKPQDTSCFQPKGLDGLIGYDFLRFFNVYVDYPMHLLVLEPNSTYETATNTVKPWR